VECQSISNTGWWNAVICKAIGGRCRSVYKPIQGGDCQVEVKGGLCDVV